MIVCKSTDHMVFRSSALNRGHESPYTLPFCFYRGYDLDVLYHWQNLLWLFPTSKIVYIIWILTFVHIVLCRSFLDACILALNYISVNNIGLIDSRAFGFIFKDEHHHTL
jgi:hypothetical protein